MVKVHRSGQQELRASAPICIHAARGAVLKEEHPSLHALWVARTQWIAVVPRAWSHQNIALKLGGCGDVARQGRCARAAQRTRVKRIREQKAGVRGDCNRAGTGKIKDRAAATVAGATAWPNRRVGLQGKSPNNVIKPRIEYRDAVRYGDAAGIVSGCVKKTAEIVWASVYGVVVQNNARDRPASFRVLVRRDRRCTWFRWSGAAVHHRASALTRRAHRRKRIGDRRCRIFPSASRTETDAARRRARSSRHADAASRQIGPTLS